MVHVVEATKISSEASLELSVCMITKTPAFSCHHPCKYVFSSFLLGHRNDDHRLASSLDYWRLTSCQVLESISSWLNFLFFFIY